MMHENGKIKEFLSTKIGSFLTGMHLPRIVAKRCGNPPTVLPTFSQYVMIEKLIMTSKTAFNSIINSKLRPLCNLEIMREFIQFDLIDKRRYKNLEDEEDILKPLGEGRKAFDTFYNRFKELEVVKEKSKIVDYLISYLMFCFLADIIQREDNHFTEDEHILVKMLKKYNFNLSFEGKEKLIVNDLTSAVQIFMYTMDYFKSRKELKDNFPEITKIIG